jgi:hypothetical protein
MSVLDPYNKSCLYDGCKKAFVAKRTNQGYCCPDCKKKANNSKAADERKLTKAIDDVIKRNRKTLDDLYNAGITTGSWNELMAKGFDYTKHTGLTADANGRYIIPQIHNFTLEKLNDQFKITKLW